MKNAGLDEAQAGIKIAGKNINNLRYANDTTYSRKWRGTKESLDDSERGEWKARLKLNIQKTKIMASSPINSCKQMGKKWRQWQILSSWAPESLWTVTAAIKLKDSCSLEEKLWQT